MLKQIHQPADMYAIHEGMMYLNGEGHYKSAVLLMIFPPVEHGVGFILLTGFRMGDMGIAKPWESREYISINRNRTGEVFLLVGDDAFGTLDIAFYGFLHRGIDNLEQIIPRSYISKTGIDAIEQDNLLTEKTVTIFLQFIRAFGYSEDKGQGKGPAFLLNCLLKMGDIKFKRNAVLRLCGVTKDLAVNTSGPDDGVDDVVGIGHIFYPFH